MLPEHRPLRKGRTESETMYTVILMRIIVGTSAVELRFLVTCILFVITDPPTFGGYSHNFIRIVERLHQT